MALGQLTACTVSFAMLVACASRSTVPTTAAPATSHVGGPAQVTTAAKREVTTAAPTVGQSSVVAAESSATAGATAVVEVHTAVEGVAAAPNGQVVVVGSRRETSTPATTASRVEVFAASINAADGVLQWKTNWKVKWGTASVAHPYVIASAHDDVYVAGVVSVTRNGDDVEEVIISKLRSSDGQLRWQRELTRPGLDRVSALQIDAAGELLLVGASTAEPAADSTAEPAADGEAEADAESGTGVAWSAGDSDEPRMNAVMMRVSADTGAVLWRRELRTTATSSGQDLAIGANGAVWALMHVDFGEREDRFRYWWAAPDVSLVFGLNPNDGTFSWYREWGWAPPAAVYTWGEQRIDAKSKPGPTLNAVEVDARGNSFLGGWATGGRPEGTCPAHDGQDPFVQSMSPKGERARWKQAGVVDPEGFSMFQSATVSLALGANDELYDAGYTLGSLIDLTTYVRRLEPATGAVVWTQRFATHYEDRAELEVDAGGDVYVAGSEAQANGSNGYVAKLAKRDGSTVWRVTVGE